MSALLEFRGVSLPQEEYDSGLSNVSFSLNPGEVMVVLTETKHINNPLCNVAQGLITPESGVVLYEGVDWASMTPDDQAVRRAGMGRIYGPQGAWLSNLDVDESITLRVRHRAHRTDQDVYEEARALAAQFGMSELPGQRPPLMSRDELQSCQCVRALLDAPKLILAEYASIHMARPASERFLELLEQRRKSGAAVIWLTTVPTERVAFGAPAQIYRYSDGALKECGSEE